MNALSLASIKIPSKTEIGVETGTAFSTKEIVLNAYKEAVKNYKETERRPIIEVSLWDWFWGEPEYTNQDKKRDLNEYHYLINKYKYKPTNYILF